MNEEEARERCKQIIKDNNEVIKEARKNRDINSMQLTASLDNDSIAIETVLNLLEKKDKYIEYWKNGFERELEGNRNNILEIINKDKQIDLMAEYIDGLDIDEDICSKNTFNPELCNEEYSNCKDCIKQYFERKVENG